MGFLIKYAEKKSMGQKGCVFKKKSAFFFFLPLFCNLLCPFLCQAGEESKPAIKDILLTRCHEQLCINFSLSGGLTRNIEKILQSGIPVKYQFEISLERKRFLWDDELTHLELARTIILDNIRDEYILNFYYPSTKIITVSTLDQASDYLFNIKQMPIIFLQRLIKGEKYFLCIKARATKGKTSMPFGGLMKMFSSFGFSTDAHKIEFQY